ncbi:MAG: 4-phosphoerythronate dehydrogenase [Halioglobus sp.]|nr:4-phosphoerythronate dehydrogenase [Halioglobus sp.]
MTIRVLVDENIPGVEHFLGPAVRVARTAGRRLQPADLAGFDALLVRSVTLVNEQLLAGSAVSFVGTATSGFDHVDRAYLAAADIEFAYAPGSNATSVVEYVLAAIAADGRMLERLLDGGGVGVVGYGQVGSRLVRCLRAMGIQCLVYDPWLDQASIEGAAELDDVLRSDVVCLHCELTDQLPWPSRHLVGRRELQQMRDDALLVNASRGSVVDQRALLEATGAAGPRVVLDVWENEPDLEPALLDRVFLGTAHIAGYSLDGKVRAARMLCERLHTCFGLEAPAPQPFLEPADTLQVDAPLAGADLVRELVRARYDIFRDDALLRGAMTGAGRVEARQAFDQLRRDYPPRRELAGSTVAADTLGEEGSALLRALDCKLA